MFADRLSPEYRGGYWHFHELGNGASIWQLMTALRSSVRTAIAGPCRQTFSESSVVFMLIVTGTFSSNEELAEVCARQYHLLREYMFEHAEGKAILAAAD
jgi:hypothetical protein